MLSGLLSLLATVDGSGEIAPALGFLDSALFPREFWRLLLAVDERDGVFVVPDLLRIPEPIEEPLLGFGPSSLGRLDNRPLLLEELFFVPDLAWLLFLLVGNGGKAQSRFDHSGEGGRRTAGTAALVVCRNGDLRPEDTGDDTLLAGVSSPENEGSRAVDNE